MSKIYEAIVQNRLDGFKKLLKIHKENINTKEYNYGYQTPLHLADQNKQNEEFVKSLLKFGANVNVKGGEKFWTPLHYASNIQGNTKIVKILIENGANVNAQDKLFLTPLFTAVLTENNTEVVKILLQNGADVNVKDTKNSPILHTIVKSRNIELLKLFLGCGVKVNARDNRNLTALHFAASERNNKEILKLLLEEGADLNAKDVAGMIPLTVAIENEHISNVAIILNYTLQMDYPPIHLFDLIKYGGSPLIRGMKESLLLLLKHLIKLQMINLLDENIDLYNLIQRKDYPMNFIVNCKTESDRLCEEVCPKSKITFLDLIKSPLVSVAVNLECENVKKKLGELSLEEKFPIYGNFLKLRIRECVKILEFGNVCCQSLRIIFKKHKIPGELFDDILRFLNEKDKKNLITAVK